MTDTCILFDGEYPLEDSRKSYLESCFTQYDLTPYKELEHYFTDEYIQDCMEFYVHGLVDMICDIADSGFPYDLRDYNSANMCWISQEIDFLFIVGKKLLSIQKEMKNAQLKNEHTFDYDGFERIFANIDYEKNPRVGRIMGSVLKTIPPNKDVKNHVSNLVDCFCYQISIKKNGCYEFIYVQRIDMFRLIPLVDKKERIMIQERLIERSFFSKIDRIIDNIYNHFMELGYDMNDENLGYRVGSKVVLSRNR